MINLFTDSVWLIGFTYILGFFAAAHAVIHIKTPQSAVAWGFMLFILPYIILPIYILFSHLRFLHFIKDYKKKQRNCERLYRPVWHEINAYFKAQAKSSKNQDILDTTLEGTKQLPIIGGHDLTLLINGEQAFQALHEEIEAAKDYILISSFLVRSDAQGLTLRALLNRRAKQGVRVYFLYDEQGCSNTPKTFWQGFDQEDVRISGFNAINGPRTLMHYNFRNHRKLAVIDGKIGFTGGLNIGQDYVDGGTKFSNWRDTHIKFDGSAVLTAQMCFCRDWYWATGEILSLSWNIPKAKRGGETFQIIPTRPQEHRSPALYVFLAAIQKAKNRIWITSPYFIPVPEILVALKHAAMRGVDIKILLPKNQDHFHVYYAGMTYIHEAVKSGLNVHLYEEGFMHQKTFLVDNDLCNIGSLNMDYRSVHLNFEIMTLSRSPKLCKAVEQMLLADLEKSIHLSGHYFERQPVHIRFIAFFIRLFSPVL